MASLWLSSQRDRNFGNLRPSGALAWSTLVACAALLLPACEAPPRTPQLRPPPVVTAPEPVLYAVRGKPLVIPLSLAPGSEPPEAVEVAFGTAPAQSAPLFWVQLERHPIPALGGLAEQAAARWLGWRDRWTVAPAWHALRPGARGFLAALASPPDGREPDSIQIAGARRPLVWIPAVNGHTPPPLRAPESPYLDAANRLLRDDPAQRWKAGLYRAQDITPFVGRRDDGRDPLLEALADQLAARWSTALKKLAEADPALAHRVASTLGGVVRFGEAPDGSTIALPCREGDPIGEEGLLRELLSARFSPEARVAAARAWLQARRRTLVWVVDDASTTEGLVGRAAATISVANLDGTPVAASVDAGFGPQLATAAPGEVTRLAPVIGGVAPQVEDQIAASLWGVPAEVLPDPADRARRARIGDELTVRAAAETFTRRVRTTSVPASPPGAPIGPLLTEWTMPGLIARAGTPADPASIGLAGTPAPGPEHLTIGVLYREAKLGESASADSPNAAGREPGWTLYLECALPPPPAALEAGATAPPEPGAAAPVGDDAVRLWFGPFGQSTFILKIGRDGVVIDETPRPAASAGSAEPRGVASMPGVGQGVRLVREEDRWVLWAHVPAGCIQDGLLRVGIERIDGHGERTTWPRPVTPWQREPGRAVIDLTAWGALGM